MSAYVSAGSLQAWENLASICRALEEASGESSLQQASQELHLIGFSKGGVVLNQVSEAVLAKAGMCDWQCVCACDV